MQLYEDKFQRFSQNVYWPFACERQTNNIPLFVAADYERGEIVSLSKEFVREHYLGTGHHDELYAAREAGTDEPPIPALPQEIIDQTSSLYASMYERLTGEEF